MDLSTLPTAAELAPVGDNAPRWRPGLAPACHAEVFASSRDAAGVGAALAFAMDGMRLTQAGRAEQRSVLWVQDRVAMQKCGRPYRPGLPPALRHRLIHVLAEKPEDALFALEEGVRCRDLACVIGEMAGNPRALDFTASRRLTLAAEKHGVPLLLVRVDAARDLSSARLRWQVRSAASPRRLWDRDAPGRPAWHAELFRARGHAPGKWTLHHDDMHLVASASTPDHGDLAGGTGARSLAAG